MFYLPFNEPCTWRCTSQSHAEIWACGLCMVRRSRGYEGTRADQVSLALPLDDPKRELVTRSGDHETMVMKKFPGSCRVVPLFQIEVAKKRQILDHQMEILEWSQPSVGDQWSFQVLYYASPFRNGEIAHEMGTLVLTNQCFMERDTFFIFL